MSAGEWIGTVIGLAIFACYFLGMALTLGLRTTLAILGVSAIISAAIIAMLVLKGLASA